MMQQQGADLAHLQSTMQAIELACSSTQMHMNPTAAEATILSLNQSPQPYKVCQFIFENSQVPNARFQAAAVIRDAAIREWGFLSGDDKKSLISFCLCYVMQCAGSPKGYVRAKVSSVAAQLIKRGWLDFTAVEKERFFCQVSCLLERLRGPASASEPRTQRDLYEMGFSVMNRVLILLEVYKHESAVVYLLLKFVVHLVDGQISYLKAKETAAVIEFCMRLLQLYSSHNIGKISVSLSSSLLSEAKTEKYKDLHALLQLLSNRCSKDLLNSEAFAHVLGTLDFGLHHQDTEVVNMCLRALRALASFYYKETHAGKKGWGAHAMGTKDPQGNLQEGILSRFLILLMQLILFEDYSPNLVSPTADALFPLILCEQDLYQKLANDLFKRQANQTLRSRLANALQSLTSSNQLSSTLDRINFQIYRKNINNFLIEVRGFLRTV